MFDPVYAYTSDNNKRGKKTKKDTRNGLVLQIYILSRLLNNVHEKLAFEQIFFYANAMKKQPFYLFSIPD